MGWIPPTGAVWRCGDRRPLVGLGSAGLAIPSLIACVSRRRAQSIAVLAG